eukprot:scaffold53525_cov31-Tisochrysis_lutea.AAC.1
MQLHLRGRIRIFDLLCSLSGTREQGLCAVRAAQQNGRSATTPLSAPRRRAHSRTTPNVRVAVGGA